MATDTDLPSESVDQVRCCDNLKLLAALPDGCVDLVYIDPPFNTGRVHRTPPGAPGAGREGHGAFADCFETVEQYVAFLRPRVVEIRRILKSTGSLLLHCDWRTSHRVRVLLDDVFGAANFVNHLIWSYGLGGSSPRRFARKHDDILFYAKTDGYYFEAPRTGATSQRLKGQTKKATDVLDIPALNNMAHERTGYPTQKPLALLELLVNACCPPGGVVADLFCGSGTTLVAAAMTDRRYVGCDVSEQAVGMARQRLAGVCPESTIQST